VSEDRSNDSVERLGLGRGRGAGARWMWSRGDRAGCEGLPAGDPWRHSCARPGRGTGPRRTCRGAHLRWSWPAACCRQEIPALGAQALQIPSSNELGL